MHFISVALARVFHVERVLLLPQKDRARTPAVCLNHPLAEMVEWVDVGGPTMGGRTVALCSEPPAPGLISPAPVILYSTPNPGMLLE